MKAVYYEKQGAAREVLQYGDLPMPEPMAGEVRVRLRASVINPSDVKTRAGLRGPLAFDRLIPHSDGSGIIDAVGEGIDESRIGESVWLYNAAFGRAHGTAAEYVCVPTELAVAFDSSSISFAAAATLGIAGQTAMAGILKGGDLRGKNVLVSGGAGAVGYYAIQFAKHAGAFVVATVSSEEKAEFVRSASPDAIVNYRSAAAVEEIKAAVSGGGIDHVVEVEFGGNLPILAEVLSHGASIAAYGSEAVREPVLPFYPLMFKNISLHWLFIYLLGDVERGAVLSALADYLSAAELLSPIAGSFALADCAGAHELVEGGKMGHVFLSVVPVV